MNNNTVYIAVGVLVVVVLAVLTWRRSIAKSNQFQGPMSTWGQAPLKMKSAADLLTMIERLRGANASWPEITRAINPKGKRAIEALLSTIRGPHQFVPHTALNVLEHGCRQALSENSRASLRDALSEAIQSMNKVVEAGR